MKLNKRMTRIYATIFALGVATALIGHGCGKLGDGGNSNYHSSSSIPFDEPEDFVPFPNTQTVSTVYAKNVLDNFVSCTGIGTESATTRGIWDSRKGSLSDFGYATHISAPMMMAITSVAGEICADLIAIERQLPAAQRNIFNSFDLSNAPTRLPNAADLNDASARLALSCWQRNVDTEERAMVSTDVGAAIMGAPLNQTQVSNAALMVCTSMLSSLSAIEM